MKGFSVHRTATSLTLLASLHDRSDETAWQHFDDHYRPLIVRFARQLGLGPDDAEEAGQRTVVAFCESYRKGQYIREKGRFKNWLLGIAQHEIADLHAERMRQPLTPSQRSSLEGILNHLRDPESMSTIWERQWTDHMISCCFADARNRFSPRDMRIFERLTIVQEAAEQVAETMNVSIKTVYNVKHRVLSWMRSLYEEAEPSL